MSDMSGINQIFQEINTRSISDFCEISAKDTPLGKEDLTTSKAS